MFSISRRASKRHSLFCTAFLLGHGTWLGFARNAEAETDKAPHNCVLGDLQDRNGAPVSPDVFDAYDFQTTRDIAWIVTEINRSDSETDLSEEMLRTSTERLVQRTLAVMDPEQNASVGPCKVRGIVQALHDSVQTLSLGNSVDACADLAARVGYMKAQLYCQQLARRPESRELGALLESKRERCAGEVSPECRDIFSTSVQELCAEFVKGDYEETFAAAQVGACEAYEGGYGTLLVRVVDEAGAPVPGLKLVIGEQSVQTDANGSAQHQMVSGQHTLSLDSSVFAQVTHELEVFADQSTDMMVRVMRRQGPVRIDANEAQSLRTPAVQLEFSEDSLVDAAGNLYLGEAQVRVTPLDVQRYLTLAPGGFQAQTEDGSTTMLESFGMVETRVTDQEGRPLRLAPGASLEISMKLRDDQFKPGDRIPLWWLDPQDGVWKEEGDCVVNEGEGGLWCSGSVTRLDWINIDKPIETGCVRGVVRDCTGKPLVGSSVSLRGINYSGSSVARSGEGGSFCVSGQRDQDISLLAMLLAEDGVLGTKVLSRTPTQQGSCASQNAQCTYVDLQLPCEPQPGQFDCNDAAFGVCTGCVSGRVELDAGYVPEGVDVVVYARSNRWGRPLARAPLRPDLTYCLPAGATGRDVAVTVESSQFSSKLADVKFRELGLGTCPNCTKMEPIRVVRGPTWDECGQGVSLRLDQLESSRSFYDAFAGLKHQSGFVLGDPAQSGEEALGYAEWTLYASNAPSPATESGYSTLKLSGSLNDDGTVNVGDANWVGDWKRMIWSEHSYAYGHAPGRAGDRLGFGSELYRVDPSSELRWSRVGNAGVRVTGTLHLKTQVGTTLLGTNSYAIDTTVPILKGDSTRVKSCATAGVNHNRYQDGEVRSVRIDDAVVELLDSQVYDTSEIPGGSTTKNSTSTSLSARVTAPSGVRDPGELRFSQYEGRLHDATYHESGCKYSVSGLSQASPDYPGPHGRWSSSAVFELTPHRPQWSGCKSLRPSVKIEVDFDIAAAAGHRYFCFVPGTPVQTPSGTQAIETLQPGDQVRCFDPENSRWSNCQVSAQHKLDHEGYIYTIEIEGQQLQATAEHPFWVEDTKVAQNGQVGSGNKAKGRWVPVQELEVGDQVRLTTGAQARISQIRRRFQKTPVYTLSVEDLHTYAVGNPGVLVHNK